MHRMMKCIVIESKKNYVVERNRQRQKLRRQLARHGRKKPRREKQQKSELEWKQREGDNMKNIYGNKQRLSNSGNNNSSGKSSKKNSGDVLLLKQNNGEDTRSTCVNNSNGNSNNSGKNRGRHNSSNSKLDHRPQPAILKGNTHIHNSILSRDSINVILRHHRVTNSKGLLLHHLELLRST